MATNFIMGLSFITEGAIPFAASDPLLFLAAVAAGSVVAMLGIVLLTKPLAAKVRNDAKNQNKKLRKVINEAQYIRTSYLSVEK